MFGSKFRKIILYFDFIFGGTWYRLPSRYIIGIPSIVRIFYKLFSLMKIDKYIILSMFRALNEQLFFRMRKFEIVSLRFFQIPFVMFAKNKNVYNRG